MFISKSPLLFVSVNTVYCIVLINKLQYEKTKVSSVKRKRKKTRHGIDLFHNGGLLIYSFICMIIGLSDLV